MGSPFSFRGAWANIKVSNPDTGKEQRFDVGQTRGEGKYLPYFTSMTMKTGLAHNAETSVVLSPPTYKDFIDLIESEWVRTANSLGVRWGYTDSPDQISEWYYSFMKPPTISIDGESYSITLNGTGFSFAMMRNAKQKVWASEDATPGPRSILDVIEEICAKYGIKVIMNFGTPLPKPISDELSEKKTALVQSGINDWAYVRGLIEPRGLSMFTTGNNKLHIFKGSNPAPPKATFRPYGRTNPTEGIWPCWGYSTSTDAMFLPGRGVAVTTFGPNAKREQSVPSVGSSKLKDNWADIAGLRHWGTILTDTGKGRVHIPRDAKDESTRSESVTAAPGAGGVKAMIDADEFTASEFMPVASRAEDGQAIAFGKSDMNVEKSGQQIEFESFDHPMLMPGDLVRMENTGKPFEGNHRVLYIEHRIGSDFSTMHVTAGALGKVPGYENKGNTSDAADASDKKPDNDGGSDKSADESAGK